MLAAPAFTKQRRQGTSNTSFGQIPKILFCFPHNHCNGSPRVPRINTGRAHRHRDKHGHGHFSKYEPQGLVDCRFPPVLGDRCLEFVGRCVDSAASASFAAAFCAFATEQPARADKMLLGDSDFVVVGGFGSSRSGAR